MAETRRIGVVIPAYNRRHTLGETLDSVIAQFDTNWECVVVDDGSTDGTAEVAQDYAARDNRIRVVVQANAGPGAARNRGCAALSADAELLAFLDSDDAWEPHALRTLREAMEASPGAVAVHGSGTYVDGRGNPVRAGQLEDAARHRLRFDGRRIGHCDADEPTSFRSLTTLCSIHTMGMVLLRRSAFEQVDGFDVTLPRAQDWDLWIRLSRLSDIPFVDVPVVRYRENDAFDRTAARWCTDAVRHRAICSPENTPAQKRFATRAYRRFYWHIGGPRLRSGLRQILRGRVRSGLGNVGLGSANFIMGLIGRPPRMLFRRHASDRRHAGERPRGDAALCRS